MLEEDIETDLKVIIVGNGQVGKTSLITRYATGVFTDSYKKTIGTDFMERDIVVGDFEEKVKMMLWDTAGQEMFSSITRNYYKGAGAVVYVFSTVNRDSFDAISEWKRKVTDQCGDSICSVLVQNKIDLLNEAVMETEEVETLARELDVKLYRTCVKDGTLVEEVFQYIATQFVGDKNEKPTSVVAVPEIGEIQNPTGKTDHDETSNEPFKLEPVRRRTGGVKKRPLCTLL
eukprot:167084_1